MIRYLIIPNGADSTDEAFPDREDGGMTWYDVAVEAGVDAIVSENEALAQYGIEGLGVVTIEDAPTEQE